MRWGGHRGELKVALMVVCERKRGREGGRGVVCVCCGCVLCCNFSKNQTVIIEVGVAVHKCGHRVAAASS